MRGRLEYGDGREAEERIYPNLNTEWPRLLYHRHFMLSESLHNRYVPRLPPPELAGNAEQIQRWRAARQEYERLRDSYVTHLKASSDAREVTITRVEHRPPTPYEFLGGLRLDDRTLFANLPDDESGEALTWSP
ncbi:MAG: hypothetical protein FJ276_30580 [Planctomycetes bacterium]|nr:hypothetical protein [Planctomycetota bacterium]